MKVRLTADYWQQRKKDEDGNVYYVRRRQGDEFEVTEAEARHLLREDDDTLRPMASKVETQQSGTTQTVQTKSASSDNKK